MLTNNFYLAVAGRLANYTELNRYDMVKTDGKKVTDKSSYVDTENFNPYQYGNMAYTADRDQLTGTGSPAIGSIIGDGTTPPTVDDYKLENQITDGFGCVASYPSDMNQVYKSRGMIICASITNNQADDLVIKEIGYIRSQSTYWTCLYDRTVLEEPITIAPNETKTIEYRLKMPQP